jgi:hypothetical protein
MVSSLLRVSPPPPSHIILICLCPYSVNRSMVTSLVPYKSLCNIPVRFAPDAMWPVTRLSATPYHGRNRCPPFSTSSALSRSQSLIQTIQLYLHLPAKFNTSLFLIVHHSGCFPPAQHKVVCILFLKIVCGRPILSISRVKSASQFARPPYIYFGFLKVFHLLYSIQFVIVLLELVQDTHGLG